MSYVSEEERKIIENYLTENGTTTNSSRQINSDVLKKYGQGCECFVETGTYNGGGIYKAIATGHFNEYISVELHEERQIANKDRFKYRDDVTLYSGWSTEAFKEILPKIEKKTFFYLDAHAEGGGVPTFEELDLIKSLCKDNNHTILVDDVPVYFGDGVALMDKLKWVNPDYTVEKVMTMEHNYGDAFGPEYQLVAFIKED